MQELERYIERTKVKQGAIQSIRHSISFAVGTIIAILSLTLFVLIVYWLWFPNVGVVKATVHIVTLDEFERALQDSVGYELFDMRTPAFYNEGHIPGAFITQTDACHEYSIDICTSRALCKEQTEAFFYSVKGEQYHEIVRALDKNMTSCWRDVYLLDGGFRAWEERELPVE